jgi:hypothetical protein
VNKDRKSAVEISGSYQVIWLKIRNPVMFKDGSAGICLSPEEAAQIMENIAIVGEAAMKMEPPKE